MSGTPRTYSLTSPINRSDGRFTFTVKAIPFQYGIAIYDAEVELVWRKQKPVASAVEHPREPGKRSGRRSHVTTSTGRSSPVRTR
ncbi:MAG: hypothetical protein NVSMB55_01120 [Mycobacteriales bacterium]